MEDSRIISMLWERKEEACDELSARYEAYCRRIASNILSDDEDVEEVLNDTWLGAWTSIPPNRPNNLAIYLGRITRNLSCKKIRTMHANKRTSPKTSLVYEELEECISSEASLEEEVEMRSVVESIERFLDELSPKDRTMFVRRYWFFDSIDQISKNMHCTRSYVKTRLWRTRKKMRSYLEESEVV